VESVAKWRPLSFIVIVFEDEITDEAKVGKAAIHAEGKLTQGMIRTPL